jgi:uncharacterized protein with FMN-binding domain
MRIVPVTGQAVFVALALIGSAQAGPIAELRIAIAPLGQTIADMEMTVSNQYGYASLRQSPGTTSKLLLKLPAGTKVIVIEKLAIGSWIRVKVGGMEGYIKANLLKAAAPTSDAGVLLTTSSNQYRDGSYIGPTVDAYYGLVQVQADIQGGRLVSVHVLQYPADRSTSRYINAQALPVLDSEVVSAQSALVDIVSGATLTSDAYLRSLNSALRQAGS